MRVRNQQYWDDLIYEGQVLTEVAEGVARVLIVPLHQDDRAAIRDVAQRYRHAIGDARRRDPHRPEHQLQDVIDAYRAMHPYASKKTPFGIGRTRPGR